ncbi:hypothetical protein [Flavicella marina]|uniref:hypothetical protein n=1 Tax=Flavicella marina TaxID=1475951 RepID=UPI0012654BC3|nr:hypothetical protein [Flavicella marina]
MKYLRSVWVVIFILLVSEKLSSQEITGIVNTKTTTIHFEDFGYGDARFNGEIHSNFTGSKYTVNLKSDSGELSGIIKDKFSKFHVDLKSPFGKIEGKIDRAPNHTNDLWDIQVQGKKLVGKVTHNMMGTEDTYELNFDNKKITGSVHSKGTGLAYDLMFGEKKITGKMKYNVSTVKHTYSLSGTDLTPEEFNTFLFIECVKLINEYINDIDEFQNNH